MNSTNSSTNLVIGVAALGVALVIAGVRISRRNRARRTAGSPEDEMREEAAEESCRLQEDQKEGMVYTYLMLMACHDGLVIWINGLDGGRRCPIHKSQY